MFERCALQAKNSLAGVMTPPPASTVRRTVRASSTEPACRCAPGWRGRGPDAAAFHRGDAAVVDELTVWTRSRQRMAVRYLLRKGARQKLQHKPRRFAIGGADAHDLRDVIVAVKPADLWRAAILPGQPCRQLKGW